MSAPKLSMLDAAVASAAASPFKQFNLGRVVRGTLWNILTAAVLALAAHEVDGWLSVALWALVALRLVPYLFLGLAEKVKDERQARLAHLTGVERHIMTTSTQLARQFGRAS